MIQLLLLMMMKMILLMMMMMMTMGKVWDPGYITNENSLTHFIHLAIASQVERACDKEEEDTVCVLLWMFVGGCYCSNLELCGCAMRDADIASDSTLRSVAGRDSDGGDGMLHAFAKISAQKKRAHNIHWARAAQAFAELTGWLARIFSWIEN